MKTFCLTLILSLSVFGISANAQITNHLVTQNAILQALPEGVTPDKANVDEIALAALTLAFSMEGELETNLTQLMVSLGELTRAEKFSSAPLVGKGNPTDRFYTSILNVASSNYNDLSVQDIIRLTAAMRAGMNVLNGAESNAITRK